MLKKIGSYILHKLFPPKSVILPGEFKTDDEFYTFLFTKHPKWNKPVPNKAERERLEVIKHFMSIIVQNNLEKKELHIIDFGCGRGWLTNELNQYGRIKGIEPVKQVVDYARKLYPSLYFEVGSIDKLEPNSTDVLIASEVIEHVPDIEKENFVQALTNAINASGYCIITTPRAEVQNEWLSNRKESGQPVESWLTENQVQSLFAQRNFHPIKKVILQQHADTPDTPLLDLYQLWLFKRISNEQPN